MIINKILGDTTTGLSMQMTMGFNQLAGSTTVTNIDAMNQN